MHPLIRLLVIGAVSVPAFALLTGCATKTYRNPTTGETRVCSLSGAFPIINRKNCISEMESLGWEDSGQTSAHSQRSNSTDRAPLTKMSEGISPEQRLTNAKKAELEALRAEQISDLGGELRQSTKLQRLKADQCLSNNSDKTVCIGDLKLAEIAEDSDRSTYKRELEKIENWYKQEYDNIVGKPRRYSQPYLYGGAFSGGYSDDDNDSDAGADSVISGLLSSPESSYNSASPQIFTSPGSVSQVYSSSSAYRSNYRRPTATEEYYKARQMYGLDSAPVVVVPAAPGLSSNPVSGTTFLPGGGICYQTGRSVNCY